jgi:hypothetical protein
VNQQALVYVGLFVNGALYLAGCFVAGIVAGNPWAWRLALAAAGVTYLCYLAQTVPNAPHAILVFLLLLSIALGATAGLSLL